MRARIVLLMILTAGFLTPQPWWGQRFAEAEEEEEIDDTPKVLQTAESLSSQLAYCQTTQKIIVDATFSRLTRQEVLLARVLAALNARDPGSPAVAAKARSTADRVDSLLAAVAKKTGVTK